ncbi:hypothetical protein SY94_1737 [Agrobacterium tumefaciens]|nr:hypothetical protein SY94_1737 [Agrobacterium tumefaciens]
MHAAPVVSACRFPSIKDLAALPRRDGFPMQNDQPLVAYALPDAVDRLFVTFGVWKTLKAVVVAAMVPRAPPTDLADLPDRLLVDIGFVPSQVKRRRDWSVPWAPRF